CANEKSEHASIQQITTTADRSNLVIIGVLSTRTLRQASSCRFGGFGRKLALNPHFTQNAPDGQVFEGRSSAPYHATGRFDGQSHSTMHPDPASGESWQNPL